MGAFLCTEEADGEYRPEAVINREGMHSPEALGKTERCTLKMEEKLSPKVEALYKAVMELLLEGKEIRKMKVSEITEQAGIGKGTAYEYFESREELLVRALSYQQRIWAENIREELSHHDGLMEQLDHLFDLLDHIIQSVKKEALEEICNIFFLSPVFKREKDCGLAELLYDLVGEAKRGGMLREAFPDEYIVLSLSGKLFSYISFSIAEKDGTERTCTSGQIRAYLADSFAQEFIAVTETVA